MFVELSNAVTAAEKAVVREIISLLFKYKYLLVLRKLPHFECNVNVKGDSYMV